MKRLVRALNEWPDALPYVMQEHPSYTRGHQLLERYRHAGDCLLLVALTNSLRMIGQYQIIVDYGALGHASIIKGGCSSNLYEMMAVGDGWPDDVTLAYEPERFATPREVVERLLLLRTECEA